VDLVPPAATGALSLINPELHAYKNSTVIFDLSDLSLSSGGRPAFSFNFYLDSEFKNKFYTDNEKSFSVRKFGSIGVDNNASVSLIIDENTPEKLFYKLTPILFDGLGLAKEELINDNYNVTNNNLLNVSESLYNGLYPVSGIGSTSFTYILTNLPERNSYNLNESEIKYFTKSLSALGEISKITIQSGGFGYKKLPNITKVRSGLGTDALLLPFSDNIGKVYKYKLNDIGFDYPTDKTLSPSTLLPKIFKIEPLSKFKRIYFVRGEVGRSRLWSFMSFSGIESVICVSSYCKSQFLERFPNFKKNVYVLNNSIHLDAINQFEKNLNLKSEFIICFAEFTSTSVSPRSFISSRIASFVIVKVSSMALQKKYLFFIVFVFNIIIRLIKKSY
jgi:hypothetical protein